MPEEQRFNATPATPETPGEQDQTLQTAVAGDSAHLETVSVEESSVENATVRKPETDRVEPVAAEDESPEEGKKDSDQPSKRKLYSTPTVEGEIVLKGTTYLTIKRIHEILKDSGTDVTESFIREILKKEKATLPSFRQKGRKLVLIRQEDFEAYQKNGGFEPELEPAY